MDKNILWVEKYRPKTVRDCILPVYLKEKFQDLVDKKEMLHLMLCGGAGMGKTTVAKAMCEELGCDYMVINGSDESGIDTFRNKIKTYASSISLTGGRKVIIIDEADYLNANSTQPALRGAMEEFASNCTFIFTCNYKNRLIEPLHSRCTVIDFIIPKDEMAKIASQFFKRVKEILDIEGVVYNNDVVAALVKKHFPDFRRVINELQGNAGSGNIDIGLLSRFSNSGINEVIEFTKKKDFSGMKKWVATHPIDPVSFFRQVYDGLYDSMEAKSIPQAVVILADYQYKQAFVADSEINIVACLTELMVNCEFK
jgi:DNA polymerase III delta prime subunit